MIHSPGSPKRRLAAAISSTAVLLAALDAYVVVTIMTEVMTAMSIPLDRPERATPIVTAYLLGYVAAMPLLGQLSDRVGRTRVIQGCLLAFAAGSVVSAAAGNLPLLVGGRFLQGASGGALLPVTFAVISDLWDARSRPVPLGLVGAAQEMGSVVGPLYGAGLATLIGWRGIFWINLPLAALAMVAVGRTLPQGRRRPGVRVDVGGGLILAAALGAIIVGLYNPDPQQAMLPPWGPAALGIGVAGLAAFVAWERSSRARLLDPRGIHMPSFSATAACSFLSGAALMVTLVDIPLLAQTLLGEDTLGGALLLARFLAALAIGAPLGGLAANRLPYRWVAAAGLLLAAGSYLLIAGWPRQMGSARHVVGPVSLPRMDVDLALAGLGLGLVIAPLASAALRSSNPEQHGVASASVVVARMMGMLIGIAALGAAGVHRFQELTADLVPPLPFGQDQPAFNRELAEYEAAVQAALHAEYGEIFSITAALCLLAAVTALAIGRPDRPASDLR
ncbi:MAG: MFS transporter [Actinomycetota bacterium]